MNTENQITKVVVDLDQSTALTLQSAFSPLLAQAQEWQAKVADVTDAKVARASRLALKAIRVEADKKHKDLKHDILLRGRAIDGMKNIIHGVIVPLESALEEIEKAEERRETARIEALRGERSDLLLALGANPALYSLGAMSAEDFARILDDAELAKVAREEAARKAEEARLEAERKAEEERKERERLAAEERKRIEAENARLRKEAAEREEAARLERERVAKDRAAAEAKAKAERDRLEAEARAAAAKAAKERAAAEAKLNAEREARASLEAEAKAKREAEEARQRKEAEEAARAAAAPDREKLAALGLHIKGITMPNVSTEKGRKAIAVIEKARINLLNVIRSEYANL